MPADGRWRRLPTGGSAAAIRTHRSAGFGGTQSLANPNSSNQFNLSAGTSLGTVSFWFKMDTFAPGTYYKMFAVGDASGPASDQWGVQIDGSNQNVTSFYSNGASYNVVEQGGLTVVTGKWYLVFAGPGTGSTIYINLYDQSGALAGGQAGATGPINQPTHKPLTIGSAFGIAGASPFIGEIDSLGVWPSRLLSGGEQTAIWNNGKAIDFAALPGSALTGLAFWANMDAASGASVWPDDSGGGNNLTATGTVTSQPGAGF